MRPVPRKSCGTKNVPHLGYGSGNHTVLLAADMGRRSFNKYFAGTNIQSTPKACPMSCIVVFCLGITNRDRTSIVFF